MVPDRSATSPQLLRRFNASAVLQMMRGADAVTVSELVETTGLTRATVIAVCEDLTARGWTRELQNQRDFGAYRKGRPARRFELDAGAGCVLGIDVGALKTSVVAADLRGNTLARSDRPFPGEDLPPAQRIDIINGAALLALQKAGVLPSRVLAATAGVAAPVDRTGNVLANQPFWRQFDVGLRAALSGRHGWAVHLENDANLAALGERWHGAGTGVDDLVVLLASERFGSGIIESGRLLHGSHGAVGEMAYLDLVDGVGSSTGIAALARIWASEEVERGAKTILALASAPDGGIPAEVVFKAAREQDAVALEIMDRLSERIARVIATVSTIINPELVVIGGAVAESVSVLLPDIARRLAKHTATPPRLAASPLGDTIVTVGAIRHALDYVEENFLDLKPSRAHSPRALEQTAL